MATIAEVPANQAPQPIKGVVLVSNATLRDNGTTKSYNAHAPERPEVQYNLTANLFEAAVSRADVEFSSPEELYGLWEVTGILSERYVADESGGYGIVHSVQVLTAQKATFNLEKATSFGDHAENSRSSKVFTGDPQATRQFGGGAVGAIMRRKPAPASK